MIKVVFFGFESNGYVVSVLWCDGWSSVGYNVYLFHFESLMFHMCFTLDR